MASRVNFFPTYSRERVPALCLIGNGLFQPTVYLRKMRTSHRTLSREFPTRSQVFVDYIVFLAFISLGYSNWF